MKYLRPYNESFNNFATPKELEEALEIYAEDLPFDMANIRVRFNERAIFIYYEHIDNSKSDLDLYEIKNDIISYFTKFAKKYDLEYQSCIVPTECFLQLFS